MRTKDGYPLSAKDLAHKNYMEWLMTALNLPIVANKDYYVGCYVNALEHINPETLKKLTVQYRNQ